MRGKAFRIAAALTVGFVWAAIVAGQEGATSGGTSPAESLPSSPSPQFLPNDAGQKWAEYDIRPYTARWPETEKPQQWVVDWILRETGTDVWFGEPLGFLSATRTSIRVYHTPEVHERVSDIVERFVEPRANSYALAVTLLTVGSPNWRSKAWPLLRSVPAASPGVDAWLLSKENAALLLADLRKRADTTDYSVPNFAIPHGQTQTIQRRQARQFARSIRWSEQAYPPYDVEPGVIDEGFSLQISPLFSRDGAYVDAAVRCHIDQVERFLPIGVDLPPGLGPTQRIQLEVPQLVSWRLHERFRWPADQVLLLSCGVVAKPTADNKTTLAWALSPARGRADALLMLDCKLASQATTLPVPPPETARVTDGNISRGRY